MDSKEEFNESIVNNAGGNTENTGSYNPVNTINCRITASSKIYFLVFMSLVFSAATVFAGVVEIIENKISFFDFIKIIIMILAAIVVAVAAFSDSRQVALFKSFIIFSAAIADILVTGIDTIKFAISTLKYDFMDIAVYYDVNEKLIAAYAVILLIWSAALYLFFALDILRCAFNIKRLKFLVIFCGYIAFISICGQIMLKMIIEGRCQLIRNMFPVNFIYVTFILSDLFAIGSKRKPVKLKKC